MLVGRRLRHEARRYGAMGATVLLAVTAFVVLTGSAATSRLETTATVDAAFRPSYDILVRPHGSRSAIERETGQVRPNYLSGIFGGITNAQARTIGSLEGVQTAAPIAMLGEVLETVNFPVDVTSMVASDGPTLLRFRTTEHTTRGLASVPGPSGYVYVASKPLALDLNADDLPVVERVGGRSVPVCRDLAQGEASSPFQPIARWSAQCWDPFSGQSGERWPTAPGRYHAALRFTFPVLVAAVDPEAEADLTGLPSAMVSGRYLDDADGPESSGSEDVSVPVLASSRSLVDQVASVNIDRLSNATIDRLRTGLSLKAARRLVEHATGQRVAARRIDEQRVHRHWLDSTGPGGEAGVIYPRLLFTTSPVGYRQSGAGLTPLTRKHDDSAWRTSIYTNEPFAAVPAAASDTAFRSITAVPAQLDPATGSLHQLKLTTVGEFDPGKISSGPALSEVPLETYHPPSAAPADDRSRRLLRGQELLPDTNPAGYLQSPPLLLTTISSIAAFTNEHSFAYPPGSPTPTAPVSVVRVRVDGVTGADAESRERVRVVAEQIRERTGLDVDIMTGSSPHPTTVQLPATRHHAPQLTVVENWIDKGVATVLMDAIDRKSLALFLLVLATSAVAVGISATASVRARRTQLGVLSCLGWRPWTILRSVLADLLVVGVLAGAAGAVLAAPISLALGVDLQWWRALVALPGAVLIVLAAGLVPAATAARAVPADAVRPAISAVRRPTRLRGTASLARSYLRRTPGRAAAAVSTLALAVASLTILAGIVIGFHDTVVGTLLGNAVSVQVRGVDIAAAVLMTVLALGSLIDILYLDIREQAPSYASLQATGWRDRTLGELIVHQAVLIAAAGAAFGAMAGLATLAWLGSINTTVLLTTIAVTVLAVALGGIAALLPARSLRRLPTAVLLSEE